MAPIPSSKSSCQSPIKRHHTNSRTAIMKADPLHNLQLPGQKIRKPRTKHLNQKSKPKTNTTISTITATPSITLLLSACRSLDHLICSATISHHEIQTWRALDPYTYLTSPILIARWKSSLETLCEQYLNGTFTPDQFEEKLMTLLPGVQKLEEARRRVNEDLERELRDRGVWVAIPETFWGSVEERVGVIDGVFEGMGRVLDSQ
ncbi:uncharacterized protein PAC_06360 [Phialocephala subalpina]|uniref:Uncharacterized protein n=1 Tax=Phialocephala subalpina TaxID=576137 RepID=A0A1L7WUL6_9HELO|nr:uncharacterized protein PAC_06360 [Phialocephala subalpina]